MSRLEFRLEAVASGSRARATTFRTLHNEVRTPVFMPVATVAAVRGGVSFDVLEASGSQVLLANTYHLLLRPGPEVFKHFGGIHGFNRWKKSFLTDSGGFQIFSLPGSRQMGEEGAIFRSYVDGQKILLTPEVSIETQKAIGSDIMMVLDQCVPSTSEHAVAEQAMHLTHRWAKRSLAARGDSPQSMFAIVQGACFTDLRKQSADFLTQLPFDGFAIGGLAVGETRDLREEYTALSADLLPKNLPRYLMGVGTPIDLLEAVHRGVDMFDCILPTALAQQGVAFTSRGRLDLRRGIYKFANEVLDPACPCPTCASYSRGYLHHLHKAREVLGWQLLGAHNLYFYHALMAQMRAHILNDTFAGFYARSKPLLEMADEDNPVNRPRIRKRRNRKAPMTLGRYEVLTSEHGFASIRQKDSGEVMHSVNDPNAEARALYVEQSQLRTKLAENSPLTIWDVGLGAAHNAMAAIHACELAESKTLHGAEIVSFENDLDSLRLAIQHPFSFSHLRHSAPHLLMEEGSWRSKKTNLSWKLLEGDFLAHLEGAPAPDLIFFDPFSYKTDSVLWTVECFTRIFKRCEGRAVELFTYSNSTAVRSALLAAGFFVARGVGTGPKADTTIALTPQAVHARKDLELLSDEWLAKWERSGAKFPSCVEPADQLRFASLIRGHTQFQKGE